MAAPLACSALLLVVALAGVSSVAATPGDYSEDFFGLDFFGKSSTSGEVMNLHMMDNEMSNGVSFLDDVAARAPSHTNS